jgi:hypothetical protein
MIHLESYELVPDPNIGYRLFLDVIKPIYSHFLNDILVDKIDRFDKQSDDLMDFCLCCLNSLEYLSLVLNNWKAYDVNEFLH